jgi:hypothetical protein
LIDRARSSDRQTDERAEFLGLVARVTSIARFERGVGDREATLSEFTRRCQALRLPMTDADIAEKTAALVAADAKALALMDAEVSRLRLRCRDRGEDPSAPVGCTRARTSASVHDRPPRSCMYSGKAWACRLVHGERAAECWPNPSSPHGQTPAEAIEAIPAHMRESSDSEPLDARERRRRADEDHRRDRKEDKRVERALRRQAEAAQPGATPC